MSSKRTKFKCRFAGCTETFRTKEGRDYHEEQRHRTWITPTVGSEKQLFNLSHFCDWNNTVAYQLNVKQDRLSVESC